MTSFADFAKLADLQTRLDGLLVLARVVVHFLAVGTGQLDESVLGHTRWAEVTRKPCFWQGPHDGADDRDRTGDLRFTKPLLYQLSYVGVKCVYLAYLFVGTSAFSLTVP